jgi:hypothetical protein
VVTAEGRRMLVRVLVLLLVVLTGCSAQPHKPRVGPSPSDLAPTAWQTLADRIGPHGEVSKQLALDMFATVIGPIPDGNKVSGQLGTRSGTAALWNVLRHWKQLTAAQRASVLSVTDGPVSQAPPTSTNAVAPSLQAFTEQVQSELDELDSRYVVFPVSTRYGTPTEGAVASTWAQFHGKKVVAGEADECVIGYSTEMFQLFELAGGNPAALAELKLNVAHELMHCHQIGLERLHIERRVGAPDWIKEGSAEWVAYLYAYPSSEAPAVVWSEFFNNPSNDLFRRTYDAVGFWAYLDHPWEVLADAMDRRWSKQAMEGISSDVLAAVRNSQGLYQWAMKVVRKPGLGPSWDMAAPGLGNQRPAEPDLLQIDAGDAHNRNRYAPRVPRWHG